MTEEERKLMISYLQDMKEEYVEGEGNERYPLPEWYMLDKVIKIIQQQPSENEEIIRVSKGALKARTGRYVIYDVKWLKEHFNTTEAKIYGQPKTEGARGDIPLQQSVPEMPQPKTGHWTHDGSSWKNRWICSECGYKLYDEQSKYCPDCGIKMEVKK